MVGELSLVVDGWVFLRVVELNWTGVAIDTPVNRCNKKLRALYSPLKICIWISWLSVRTCAFKPGSEDVVVPWLCLNMLQ